MSSPKVARSSLLDRSPSSAGAGGGGGATSDAAAVAAVPSTNSFPAEVISIILAHALPTSHLPIDDSEDLSTRQKLLLSFLLVNKAWCAVARPLLYSRLYIVKPSQAWKFHEFVTKNPKGSAVPLVEVAESLKLGGYNGGQDSFGQVQPKIYVLKVACDCVALTTLWLVQMTAPFDPAILSVAVGLKSLFLECVSFTIPKAAAGEEDYTWHFPKLETLSCDGVTFEGRPVNRDFSFLFHPRSLPVLTSLAFMWHATDAFPHFPDLAPQLKSLFLLRRRLTTQVDAHRPPYPLLPVSLQSINGVLDHLTIDIHSADDFQYLTSIESSLKSLFVVTDHHERVEEELCAAVKDGETSLCHLETLFLVKGDGSEETKKRRKGTTARLLESETLVIERKSPVIGDAMDFVNWLDTIRGESEMEDSEMSGNGP